MPRYRYENNELVQYTAQEEALRDAEETAWTNGAYDRAINELRQTRNNLLAKTDWAANSDLVLSDEMKAYRKKLRDAPTGLDTVEKVKAYEFPTEVLS